ncbi:hypothetical protein B7R87_26510 [Streptomyces tsukubensis]|uniref:DUF317 domain-containing protein n=2 Tax=Streptomyces TaxID=1883 RepID=I2N7Z4_STRT9|nr:hypothetical protein B7R87_26510 [Streptomyces tsukubensis]EIF93141.1 hypothetical protein [Streptomyces tsukubensis NRRL18488]QKM66999.1 DUF317 domain-containing protein [Streptomyces tsukubensis NRRL18488]
MPHPEPAVHVRLALYPDHQPAVTATLTGSENTAAREILLARGFRDTAAEPGVMVLARIDREEPYYAARAAEDLARHGCHTVIEPALQEEIDTEWTWGNYPMDWLTRDEVREVSAAAQEIHDDIASGRLTIHLHAHDGWTTVAVGTHQDGRHLHLHGEDHLRQISGVHGTEAEAVAEFHRLYSVAVRPGPAPATETERAAAAALAGPRPATASEPTGTSPETAPARVPALEDHEAVLASFLEAQGEWEKWRTWDDNCTYAVHESQTIRVEFDHEVRHRSDTAWTVAAYETPVGERLWHATATAGTPAPIMSTLLESLTNGDDAWGHGPTPVTEKTIAEATRPLGDAGWTHIADGHGITLTPPGPHQAGVRFDPLVIHPHPAWTLWSGNPDRPNWAIRLSPYAPAALLQDLAAELAYNAPLYTPRPNPAPPRRTWAVAPAPPRSPSAPAQGR